MGPLRGGGEKRIGGEGGDVLGFWGCGGRGLARRRVARVREGVEGVLGKMRGYWEKGARWRRRRRR